MPRVDTAFAEHPETAAAVRHTIGSAYASLGEVRKAAELHERTWRDYQDILGEDAPTTLRARYDMVRDQLVEGDFGPAQEHVRALAESLEGGHEIEGVLPEVLDLIAAHLDVRGGDAEALERGRQILDRAAETLGEGDETVMEMRSMHLRMLIGARSLEAAEPLARRQLELIE